MREVSMFFFVGRHTRNGAPRKARKNNRIQLKVYARHSKPKILTNAPSADRQAEKQPKQCAHWTRTLIKIVYATCHGSGNLVIQFVGQTFWPSCNAQQLRQKFSLPKGVSHFSGIIKQVFPEIAIEYPTFRQNINAE